MDLSIVHILSGQGLLAGRLPLARLVGTGLQKFSANIICKSRSRPETAPGNVLGQARVQ